MDLSLSPTLSTIARAAPVNQKQRYSKNLSAFTHQGLDHLVATYGYLAVALGVGLESMGLPIPGETILVVAAVYAATCTGLNIWLIVVAASAGAIVGDNLGYWLGSRFGYPLLGCALS